jgi:hypothetical protein
MAFAPNLFLFSVPSSLIINSSMDDWQIGSILCETMAGAMIYKLLNNRPGTNPTASKFTTMYKHFLHSQENVIYLR